MPSSQVKPAILLYFMSAGQSWGQVLRRADGTAFNRGGVYIQLDFKRI